jgi:hypothetical protein
LSRGTPSEIWLYKTSQKPARRGKKVKPKKEETLEPTSLASYLIRKKILITLFQFTQELIA